MMRVLALRVASTVLGVTCALVAMEILLRVSDLAPTEGVMTVTETQFQSVPGLLAPHQGLVDRHKPALPHRVHVNSLGYRGRELAWNKAAREIRILMVGDSFTYGEFVSDDETMPAQLERELGPMCEGFRIRVINAGIGGTTIDTHARMVERALPLRPDLVILTFSENDLEDLDNGSAWDRFASNRRLKSSFPLAIFYPALSRLALWHFALDARVRLGARFAASAAGLDTEVSRGHRRETRLRHLSTYTQLLTGLRDRVAAYGIELMLVLFPSHLSLREDGPDEQLEWLMRIGGEAGLTTVNLLAPLRESGQTRQHLYLLPHDGHPSAHAYATAARFLAGRLGRGELLGKFCAQYDRPGS
jgi:hypothetical protein